MTAARIDRQSRGTLAIAGLIVLLATALLLAAPPSDAQEDPPPPISTEVLTGRHEFTDDIAAQLRLKPEGRSRTVVNLRDASNLAVLRITVQPGARFPWHNHPGPVMVAVTTGELVYVYADDCVQRPYPAGTAFVDPGGSVHMAFNQTSGETVVHAIFLGAPETGPLTLPVDADQGAAFDDKCGASAMSSARAH